MRKTLSFFTLVLQKDFSAFCSHKLQEIGLTQGLLYFILYVGKHSGCSTGDLIKALHMDWGHAQRSIEKLVQDGFIDKQKDAYDKRAYCLSLTEKGKEAFDVSHQVFIEWDTEILAQLADEERAQLLGILEKLVLREEEYCYVRNNQQPH